uniref:Uncharacterized protein n=1 Tax=Tanacetum cinerariifolium TaxID=118510 RepID=A0A6L2NG72_TANCI|nr:hypothetical protein [Tanacetum cinerariifolium]GEZ70625.1 hypothetical protein [Tanacetum cinerariifolium]
MEECFKALTYKLDWNNLEGDRSPFDLTKPLPLKGRPGRLTVAAEYFFNNDMEFLKSSDPEIRYTTSITKIKAACVNVKKLHGYGNLEDIVVRRVDHQLYKFKEGVIYKDLNKQKRVMQADELYNFSDGILKTVRDKLHHQLLDFRLGYNDDTPSRKWTSVDKTRSCFMVDLIDKHMFKRRII